MRARRLELLLFLGFFSTFAYFHQGGGWNQNSRFALVRSIVEERRFAIDSYLVYLRNDAGAKMSSLRRVEVRNGTIEANGERAALGWPDEEGRVVPVAGDAAAGLPIVSLMDAAATGDVSFGRGSFHPNKAPGTSLAAIPAYAVLYWVERAVGADPDAWWTLTLNAWLTSAWSVGLLAALGCVLFHRLALHFSDGRTKPALFATLAFGLGTLFLPYATMLYEHDIVAVALLASFYLVARGRDGRYARAREIAAGACAGFALVSNYAAAPAIALVAAYLGWTSRERAAVARFLAGALVPCILLGVYHAACFGTPFTTTYAHETPAFHTARGTLFSVLTLPSPTVLLVLLFSPFRGLFVGSPVLLLGVVGLVRMLRSALWRREACLCLAMVALFLLINASFNGWHGGAAVTPRYLGPAIPFLALPIVFAFEKLPRLGIVLLVFSVAAMLLATVVDPQCPLGTVPIAQVEGRPLTSYDPWTEYEIPLFVSGRAEPVLRAMMADSERRGEVGPLLLGSVKGPVSANPVGVYEGWPFTLFPPDQEESRLNSFNAGELLFPGSRLSLLPLALLWGMIATAGAFRYGGRWSDPKAD